MKANEAKSIFVYPDKLYARCKDNKTLDISYAPQILEAVEYTRTDAFIEKACDAYCRLCDTKECGDDGECIWVKKFRKLLVKF